MNSFVENLKRHAQENPIVALGVAAVTVTAVAKLIDAIGHAKGANAYARMINNKIK